MRELLVTITLLSLVSSEEFEAKKRLELPPEVDPNFWPVRGRRSYWDVQAPQRYFGNLVTSPENDYTGYSTSSKPRFRDSWPAAADYQLLDHGDISNSDNWRTSLCPRKKSISLVLPLKEFHPEDYEVSGCVGRCGSTSVRGRGRRGDERWRRQQPLYVEEPRWIKLDYNHEVLDRSAGNEDPFFVARGKKHSANPVAPGIDLRERRHLDEMLNGYNVDPFFVARGKRHAEYDDKSSRTKSLGESSKAQEKPKSDSGSKKNSEEVEGRIMDIDYVGEDLTEGLKDWVAAEERRQRRRQRSPGPDGETEPYKGDARWSSDDRQIPGVRIRDAEVLRAEKPRYSRSRDKHSNLQSMLEEPFFISRGKKDTVEYLYGHGDELPSIRVTTADVDSAVADVLEIYRSRKDLDPFEERKSGDDASYYGGEFQQVRENAAKKAAREKSPRNRRGMLEDLLKGDDPFYVARGKKLSEKVLDHGIDGYSSKINVADHSVSGKSALIANAARAKLMRTLYEFSKQRAPGHFEGGSLKFWNLTGNAAHDSN